MGLFTEGGLFRRTAGAEAERKRAPKPPITMGMIGNPCVIDNLKRAAALRVQEDPRANEYHFVGIWPGRGQASIIQEGQIRALMTTDHLKLFDAHIAGSGGSGPVFAAHYGLEQSWRDIFPEANPEIPLFRRGRLNIEGLGEVFRTRTPERFSEDTRVENVFVSVTHANTGRTEAILLDPQDEPLNLLLASMSIPGMAPPRDYRGQPRIDGVVGDPLPISRVLNGDTFRNVNNIIVFLAAPLNDNEVLGEAAGYLWELFGGNAQIATLLKTQPERTRREAEFITGRRKARNKRGEPVNIVAIGPTTSTLSPFTMDGEVLTQARDIAQQYTTTLLQT